MGRRLAPTIGLLLGLAPALAQAQTNLDQGKTPAQIFAADCAACHKAARGLASGKNSLTLTSFLREHYTTSREQAAALAAYVLGAGPGTPADVRAARAQKPAAEPARTPAEEAKPGTRQARQPAKPDDAAPATAKLQPPAEEEPKPERRPETSISVEEPTPAPTAAPAAAPGRRPTAGRHEQRAPATARGRHREPPPAAVMAAPRASEPGQDAPAAASAGAAPTEPGAGSSDNSPVPRDDIPD